MSIDISQFKSGLIAVGYGGDVYAGRRGIAQIITEGQSPTINWVIKPYQWDTFYSNEKVEGTVYSVECTIDWFYFMMYPL